MKTYPIDAWVPDLLALVRKAGSALMKIYQSDQGLEVMSKADESPVTIADFTSNEILMQGLKEIAPDIPIISEESKSIPYEVRKTYDYFWIIDPLDGTKEFVKNLDEFSIHLALVYQNRPIAGFIFAPVFDDMYYAIKGGGAWREWQGETTQLFGHEVDLEAPELVVIRSRSNLDAKTKQKIESMDRPKIITMGSGLKFMRLITGEADYYPRVQTNMKEWDVAPAQIILEEAGGALLDWESKDPLVYNKKELTVKGFEALSKV